MGAFSRQIVARFAFVLAAVVAALAMTSSSAFSSELPGQWDPRTVAVNHDAQNSFLLRPGQILAGPGDAADVQRVLTGWRQGEQRPFGITVFTRAPQSDDPAKEILAALAQGPQGHGQPPARARAGGAQPRVRRRGGGARRSTSTASRACRAGRARPCAPRRAPRRCRCAPPRPATARACGSPCSTPACSSTSGSRASRRAPLQRRRLGRRARRLRRRRVRPRHVHRRPDRAGRARRVRATRSRCSTRTASATTSASRPRSSSCPPTSTSSTSRSAATPTATRRRWRSRRAVAAFGAKGGAVVAAAGNHGKSRPFWPAAFEPVVAVGAVEEDGGKWWRADYSNHGAWVDAAARGSNLQSTFTRLKTKVAQGATISPHRSVDRLRRLGDAGTGPRSPRRSPPR